MSLYDQLLDPSNAALLGMSAGLLQAGGPSPYRTGVGPAIGAGIVSGMQAGTQARDAQLKQGLLAEQLKRAIAQGKMLDLLTQQYGGQGQAPGGVAQPPQPMTPGSAALMMGATQGTPGPTMGNAALMNQYQQQPQTMPPMAPQQPAAPSYFNPQNLFAEGRLGMLAGLHGSEGLMTAALSHDPNIAGPVALAQKGFQGAPGGGVQLTPGFAAGQGQIAGAEAGAKFPYEALVSTLRNAGRPLTLGPGQTAVSGFSMLPPFLQQAVTGGMGGAPGAVPGVQAGVPPGPMPTATGMAPIVAESQRQHAGEMEKLYGTWQNEANSAQQDNLLIDRMRNESQGFSPGKMAESFGNVQAYLARIPGMDTPERKGMLADFQAFQKNATQLSTSAARTMGAREPGSVIAMFKNAYPNAELTSNAMNAMFTQIQGLNDYKTARQAGADAWRGSHQGTLEGFQSSWNKTADPMFFVVQRMPPEVRQQFFGKMSPTERQSFGMKYQSAITSGFLQPAQ